MAADDVLLPLDKQFGGMPEIAPGLKHSAEVVDDTEPASDPSDASRRAALLLDESSRQSAAGDPAGALTSIEAAVASYTELAAANSAFAPDLAGSLNKLSVQRSAAGDQAGGLAAIEDAVDLFRELAETNPAAFTADLGMSLNNLSVQRSAAGDLAGARTAIEEAVSLYRELAETKPVPFKHNLAMSLNNLSVQSSAAGDRAGALTAVEEAVATYRELAATNRGGFVHDLAMSLNNLSVQRSAAGDQAGGLTAIEEAVAAYRELAASDPAGFTHHLVMSSNLLADQLAEAGENERALDAWDRSCRAIAVPQFGAYVAAAAAGWLDHRGDDVHAEALIRQAVKQALDPTGTEPEADPESSTPRFALGESRQYVRSVAMSMDPRPDGLPSWAVDPIRDADLDLAQAWAGANSWSAAASLLRERSEVVSEPALSDALDLLLMLHPGDRWLTGLAAMHKDIVERGLSEVLEDLTARDELHSLINGWISADTWTASFTYLSEHLDRLRTDEVVQLLIASGSPTASQHAAILTLCETATPAQIEELVANVSATTDLALDELEAGNLGHVHVLTLANPRTLQLPGTGPLLQAVLLLAVGDPEGAATAARAAAETATEAEHRAHTIRLGNLAKHADAVKGGAASVTALIEAYGAAQQVD
ncbi:MAG: hypothetical protein ABI899_09630 [Actinomycetota bacterium]